MIWSEYLKNLPKNKEIYLRIKALPRASKSQFLDLMADGTLKIALAAPAEKGKANQELIKFLAAYFLINKDKVHLIAGAGGRSKLVKINF